MINVFIVLTILLTILVIWQAAQIDDLELTVEFYEGALEKLQRPPSPPTSGSNAVKPKETTKIVHCKDCRRNGTVTCAMFCMCEEEIMHSWNEADDFCSWGERERK